MGLWFRPMSKLSGVCPEEISATGNSTSCKNDIITSTGRAVSAEFRRRLLHGSAPPLQGRQGTDGLRYKIFTQVHLPHLAYDNRFHLIQLHIRTGKFPVLVTVFDSLPWFFFL